MSTEHEEASSSWWLIGVGALAVAVFFLICGGALAFPAMIWLNPSEAPPPGPFRAVPAKAVPAPAPTPPAIVVEDKDIKAE